MGKNSSSNNSYCWNFDSLYFYCIWNMGKHLSKICRLLVALYYGYNFIWIIRYNCWSNNYCYWSRHETNTQPNQSNHFASPSGRPNRNQFYLRTLYLWWYSRCYNLYCLDYHRSNFGRNWITMFNILLHCSICKEKEEMRKK